MNQDKAKPRGGPVSRNPEAKASKPPGAPPAPAPPAKIEVNPMLLSPTLARDLRIVPQMEWYKIESIPWKVPFTRDMAEGVRFVDAVAYVLHQKGGLFTSPDLNRRRNLEQDSQEILDAFRALIGATVEVARKHNLTNILEKHWRLLSVYGPPPKKAEAAKARSKPDAAKQGRDPASAA